MNPSRTPLVAGNWKMNLLCDGAATLARAVVEHARRHAGVEVVVAPTFTALSTVRAVVQGTPVGLAAQNLYHKPQGAFTGEIAPAMLADVGCSRVILGHSERRHVFGETDELVGLKVRAALDNDLVPILCVGEKLEEREAGRTLDVVRRQYQAGVQGLDAKGFARLVVAYEPVWAIGTGKVASPADAQAVHAFLRKLLAESKAETVRILYGGSVTGQNAAGLLAMPDIDGALVGGASLKADDFGAIIGAAGRNP